VHSKFHNVIRGVQSKYEEGCAFKISAGVCIGMCAFTGVHFYNAHPLANFECTPLALSVELWSDPVGARRRRARILRRRAPPLTHLAVHGTTHPMSAASVRPQSAADCLIRSAVDISHLRVD